MFIKVCAVTKPNNTAVVITLKALDGPQIANFFSLFVEMYFFVNEHGSLDVEKTKDNLIKFESKQPEYFRVAGQEAVNNKQQREIRGECVKKLLA